MKTVEQIRKEYPDFKSPKELGITDQEYCALNEVREGLCQGRYHHALSREKATHACSFNMHQSMSTTHCGTIGCIGGWMGMVMGKDVPGSNQYVRENRNQSARLRRLFYPSMPDPLWWHLTPERSAQACANFLHGKADPWEGLR